jgi:hypothetical protein
MTMTSRLARVAVAATVLSATTGAFAEGTFTPELGWGRISGGHVYHDDFQSRDAPSIDAAFGYRWDNGFGARVLWIGAFNIARDLFPNDTVRTFDEFYGVQATGMLPLASHLNLNGGLGIGSTSLNRGTPGDHVQTGDGVVSAGLQYRPFTHFALELHVDYLTRTHERNIALTAQVPF